MKPLTYRSLRRFFPRVIWRWTDPNETYRKPNPWTYRPTDRSVTERNNQP